LFLFVWGLFGVGGVGFGFGVGGGRKGGSGKETQQRRDKINTLPKVNKGRSLAEVQDKRLVYPPTQDQKINLREK